MVRCGACGQDNPAGFRFCGACGVPLEAAAAAPATERKLVSVLFADLVGFTAASESADPEDVQHRLGRYHRAARQAIEQFGGTVEKFIGDAVMAIFGAPTAREDDAERAVLAGLAIIAAVEAVNAEESGLDLAVRVGVNTGEALVTLTARPEQGEGMVTGDVVNTAARLQSVAPVGGVAIGEVTHVATRHAIEQVKLEPAAVKGKAQPLRRWQALGAARGDPAMAAPLIGRRAELETLRGAYDRAREERRTTIVTITGDPGVGKSRLVEELRRTAQPARWLMGRCRAYGQGASLRALGDVVKAHAGILETDALSEAEAKLDSVLEELVAEPGLRRWVRGHLASLIGSRPADGPPPGRDETFAACTRYLSELATGQPTILVFEDLHWDHEVMVGFLQHLAGAADPVPMLVVATARPELREHHPDWDAGFPDAATVSLAPLEPEETATLLEALDAELTGSAELLRAVRERSGGNPLYAQELVRMLQDRRLDGIATAELDIPQTVHAVIAARLDALRPEVKRSAQAAAVVGQVFWSAAIAAVTGAGETAVLDHLLVLARLGLVHLEAASSVAGTAQCTFHHALVRDVAYGQLPRTERVRLHRDAGAWIEQTAGERSEELAEVLAHHYVQAVELGRATRDERLEDAERAGHHLARAGRRVAGIDVERSLTLVRRASELLPQGHPSRLPALVDLIWGLFYAGQMEEHDAVAREVYEVALRDDAPSTAAFALVALAQRLEEPFGADAERMMAQALELLEQAPDSIDKLWTLHAAAQREMIKGEPGAAVSIADEGVAVARRLGGAEAESSVLEVRGLLRNDLGDLGGLDDLRAAVDLQVSSGMGQHACLTYANLGDALWSQHGAQAALDLHHEAIAFATERGATAMATWLRAQSLWMLFDLGLWDALLAEASVLAQERLDHGEDAVAGTYVGAVAWLRGDHADDVRSQLDHAVALARDVGEPQLRLPALSARATVLAGSDRDAATDLLLESLTVAPDHRSQIRGRTTAERVRAAISAGRLDLAERILDEQEPLLPRNVASVASGRAALHEAQGRSDAALAGYRNAIDLWNVLDGVVEVAIARLGAARCAADTGPRLARELAAAARATFAEIGAVGYATDCDAVLGRLDPVVTAATDVL